MTPPHTSPANAVGHYENFPVASWLCPPALRPAVVAIYGFARTADDIADEGDAAAEQRLAALAELREGLLDVASGRPAPARFGAVLQPLARAIAHHGLPLAPLTDLLSAFSQDVVHSRDGRGYADRAALLDYCRRSANPVGRLLLHLYGISDARALAGSDSICTALQLINFWQDLSVDVPRGRYYLPATDCRDFGLDAARPDTWAAHPAACRLVQAECAWARELMLAGAGLPLRVPGRAGWELRAVVQGGLRILDKIEALGFDTFAHRPRLHAADAPRILWRSLRMEQSGA
ncbi:squalene synthase HpnC [Ramlibacter sp. AN1015]|uniref:squalene synthase HpnC n=1 Tax=Ramlibacter sp. AN1015 TaxID=3133428 RepID=UPI0030C1788F